MRDDRLHGPTPGAVDSFIRILTIRNDIARTMRYTSKFVKSCMLICIVCISSCLP